jgi:hypothetical protein
MAGTTSTIIDQMSGVLGTTTFDREPQLTIVNRKEPSLKTKPSSVLTGVMSRHECSSNVIAASITVNI